MPSSKNSPPGTAAVFFDRDGVVNISPGEGFVSTWEDFQFTPGITDALGLCKENGYLTVLVTNQRAISLGLLDEGTLQAIHAQMQAALAENGTAFDAIYAAVGDRTDPRRKPNPNMLLEAASDLGLDLSQCLLIGDDPRDIACARAGGLRAAIQLLGDKPESPEAEASAKTVEELVGILRRLL